MRHHPSEPLTVQELLARLRYVTLLFAGVAVGAAGFHLIPWAYGKLAALCLGIVWILVVTDEPSP